jgi:hypothetical protein
VAVAFDAVGPSATGQQSAGSTNLSWTHSCVAANTVLIVAATCDVGADGGFSLSATVDGSAMTSISGPVHTNNSTVGFLNAWWANVAASGNHSVVVTAAGGTPTDMDGGSISLSGASGIGTPATPTTGNSTAPSITVGSTTSGNMVVAVCGDGSALTTSGGSTSRFTGGTGGGAGAGFCAGETASSTGSPVTLAWTAATDFWAVIAVEVQAGGSAAGPPALQFRPGKTWLRRFRHRQQLPLSFTAATAVVSGPPVRPLPGPVRAQPAAVRGGNTGWRPGRFAGSGPPLRAPDGPVRAQPAFPWLTGRTRSLRGPLGVTGPAIRPPDGPVRAQPGPQRGGRTASRAGAFTAVTPQAGPPVRPLDSPVQARSLPARGGSASSRDGTYSGTGPALRPPDGPVRAQQPPGRVIGRVLTRAGTFTSTTPQAGPPVYPLHGPVRARPPQGPAAGRVTSRRGPAGTAGPPLRPLAGPVMSRRPPLGRTGRTQDDTGPYGGTGPPVVRLRRPVRGQPQKPVLTGRALWRTGTYTAPPPPPALQNATSAPLVTALFTSGPAVTASAASAPAVTPVTAASVYGSTYTSTYPLLQVQPAATVTDPRDGTSQVTPAATSSPAVSDG